MGSFLTYVGNLPARTSAISDKLTSLSLSKIKEMHGQFRHYCDTFAINLTDYETIFKDGEQYFSVWDTDNNGLIEALEIFTGLALHADSKAEDKIRFLFDLFDFNEIQTISAMDLEFALQCAVLATMKMHGLHADLNETEITILVRDTFKNDVRITLPQLLKWCSSTEEVTTYFSIFRMDGPEMIPIQTLSYNHLVIYDKFQSQLTAADTQEISSEPGEKEKAIVPVDGSGRFYGKQACQLITNKRSLYFRAWLTTAIQPLISYRLESKSLPPSYQKVPDELKVKLEWVYGIRSSDTRRAVQYTVGSLSADSVGASDNYQNQVNQNNEELVYYIASVVVLLNTRVNKQRFYLSHNQEVISVAVSTLDGQYIASGELAINPCIHIWSSRTLESLSVIKGLHSQGVHLLQFTNDNRFLVTCGITNPSAVIIYDWNKNEVVISTSIHAPTQEIMPLHQLPDRSDDGQILNLQTFNEEGGEEINKPTSGVVVVSLREIIIFTVTDGVFQQSYLPFDVAEEEGVISPPISGLAIIVDDRNKYASALGLETGQFGHIFITGHKDGKVRLWSSEGYIGTLTDYRDEVVAMTKCFQGIAICTWRGFIHLWDNRLTQCTKTIELSNLPFKILSNNIQGVDYNKKRILVVTLEGDVIEISLQESGGQSSNVISAKRINAIVKISGQQKAMSILNQEEPTVVIAGDNGLVVSFDIQTHELIDVWALGAKITALATFGLEDGGSIIAAGTAVGNLILRRDWEEIEPRYHPCGSKTINDLAFSKNGLILAAASSDKHIYMFQYADQQGEYVKLAAVKLENGFPISINFSYDSRKIVVSTNQRKLILLDPQSFILMFKPEDLSHQFWSHWIGRYPLVTKSQNVGGLIPICLGNKSNIVAAGDENGNVYFWRDADSIKDHIGVNLTGHSSSLQRLGLTEDDRRLLSLAANDQCLFQWKVSPVEQKTAREATQQQEKKQFGSSQNENKIILQEVSLINELNFCFLKAETEEEQETSKSRQITDIGLLIRGCNNEQINMINSKLNFDSSEEVWKRPPGVALVLDHIYGVQTSDRRSTVIILHFHDDKPVAQGKGNESSLLKDKTVNQTQASRLKYGPQYEQEIKPESALTYDAQHANCSKHLAYFTSRFGILYSPAKNAQTFYQGHSLKISCIQKHPFRKLVATGEVKILPTIHIWDAVTLEPLMVLSTAHQGGILHLAFSPDGKKLVSIGMDRVYSIQVFQWEQNRTLAFRNLGYFPVFGLKFYPYENSKFITCGYEHMAIWSLKGNHLTCSVFEKYECQKTQTIQGKEERLRSVLMCVDFLNYRLGHSIQSDVLFGTSLGQISTYCNGKHFVINEQAHKGAVNCIRVSDKLIESVCIITGGEDGIIKLWTSSMQLIQQVDLRASAKVLKEFKNFRCYGIQSIELYFCDKQHPRRLLVGLRCGEILEAVVSDIDDRFKNQQLNHKANKAIGAQNVPEPQLKLEFFTYVSAHSSLNMSQNQKKISCVVMPTNSVLASVGDDETLRLWDLQKKQIIVSKYLGAQATSLAFSPDSSYLIVGLLNGVLLVLEARIGKLNFGSYMEEFELPSLNVVMSPKEAKAAVVAIKFSYRGDYMAISYNNESRKGQADFREAKAAELGALEPSFVLIYLNKNSTKNTNNNQRDTGDPYIFLKKIILPLNEYGKVLRSQLAVTTFDFSECDRYLQMFVQKINHEAVIDTSNYKLDENVYVVWDLQNDTMISKDKDNQESIKTSKWPNWSMAPAINARYHGSQVELEDQVEERQLLFKELSHMSRIQRFSLMDNAICGSHSGGLYLFRFQALTVERLKAKDFRFDHIKKKEMAATRCFSGHTSMIQSLEVYQDKIVVSTSVSDQCIVQWRVEYEDQHWELDYNTFKRDVKDPYDEIPDRPSFEKLKNEVWNVRQEVSNINQGISKKENLDPACELELDKVIGRRGFDRRGNVKIDCMDRIAYQASSLQVFMSENDDIPPERKNAFEPKIKQFFLRPDGNTFTTVSPELSCFCFSRDLRVLFAATGEVEANVYIWEVTTNMKLGEFKVPNVPIITNIKVSHDNKKVLFVGLTREYYQMISMVDWTKDNQVMFTRQFLHSLPYKIRDIEFMPESTMTFITCGLQHLVFWRLSGSNLVYQSGELTIPKAFLNLGSGAYSHKPANQGKYGLSLVTEELQQQVLMKSNNRDDDLENLFVTFMQIAFVGGTLITSGDDGFLYLWDGDRIVRRIFAHEAAVYAMHQNSKLGLLVSGSLEGTCILWRLLVEQKSNIKSLEKLRSFNLRRNLDPHTAVLTPECNIQSVCLGFNRIVVGMRTGSVYEVKISNQKTVESNSLQTDTRKWIRCIDDLMPKSVGIDMHSQRIFLITENGLFSAWSLKTFDIIFQKNHSQKARGLQAWRLSQKVMLIFQNQIKVCNTDPALNKFEEIQDHNLPVNQISYATLSYNEQILGLATQSASSPEVTLFATDGDAFTRLKQIFGFSGVINYLDFSTDNGYMQVETTTGEVVLYEIETDRPIKTEAIDFELEWLGDGLRTYPRVKGLRNQYNQSNTIVNIKKIYGKPIVAVTDQIGTIRLFNYPNIKGEPYYQCYTDHLFKILDCQFSADSQYLVTVCAQDKSIFKWRLKYNEDKVKRMLEEDQKRLNEKKVPGAK